MADFIHFRSSPELEEAINSEVDRLRNEGLPPKIANKSAVARTLLLVSLGDDERKIIAEEILRRVYAVAQAVINQAVAQTMTSVPELLESELGLEGDEG